MGALCCCSRQNSEQSLDETSYLGVAGTAGENITEEEKRRRAAEAAEKRLQQQQMRGIKSDDNSRPIRMAHSELPGNVDSNLRWQVS